MREQPSDEAVLPLVVDVDGTLICTDLLHEAALQYIAQHPFGLWRIPVWLMRGKAALKAALADHVGFDRNQLPFRPEVIALIDRARAAGQPIWLASASDRRWVEAVAHQLGGVDGIEASDGETNLAGEAKAATLVARFGSGGFDYAGDRPVDFAVWRAARRRHVVAASTGFEQQVLKAFPDADIVARPRSPLSAYRRALRPHQWAKNLLVFLPVLAGHAIFEPGPLLAAILAFVAFSLAASSAYSLNDLLDLPSDREHPRKRFRPYAAGAIPVAHGVIMAVVLMLGALAIAAILPVRFGMIWATYVVMTLAYSMYLKRRLLLDVIVLGGLYTIRVLGGLAASGLAVSQWLLMFSLFLFTSLAIVKRCSELVARRNAGKTDAPGRGYRTDDLAALLPLTAAAAFGAVLVFTLYLASPQVTILYRHPLRLWLITPLLLYWIGRMLIISNRGELHDDPVVFALTDRVSWMVGAVCALIVLASV